MSVRASAVCAARHAASWRNSTGTPIASPISVAIRLGEITTIEAAPSQSRSRFGMRASP